MTTQQDHAGQAKIAATLRGGYYVAALGLQGKPWSQGANEGQVSPVFLTRQEAEEWAQKHHWQLLGN